MAIYWLRNSAGEYISVSYTPTKTITLEEEYDKYLGFNLIIWMLLLMTLLCFVFYNDELNLGTVFILLSICGMFLVGKRIVITYDTTEIPPM